MCPVEDGVVGAEEDGDGVGFGEVLEDPHLPQGAGAVERAAAEGAAHLEHGAFVARFIDVDAADVGGDVEVVLLDPGGVAQVERGVVDLAPQLGEFLDPAAEFGAESVEGVLDLEAGHIDEQDRPHDEGLLGGLEVQQARVEPGHPFHGCPRAL